MNLCKMSFSRCGRGFLGTVDVCGASETPFFRIAALPEECSWFVEQRVQ